jgi:outer membrane lipoprotein
MLERFLFLLVLISFLFAAGCAHVISRNLRDQVNPLLTFRQVRQNPNEYKGKIVLWGGEIIRTINQKDGSTLIEVLQRPLDRGEEPDRSWASEGRFLVLENSFLDPYIYRTGRKITVAGEIEGERTQPLGEMDYRYPLLLGKEIYVWKDYYYRYPYDYYDPWWPYRYWPSYPYSYRW